MTMDDDESGPFLGQGPAKVISVSLPEGTVRALREIAGPRGVSALIKTAVEKHLRDEAVRADLAEYQETHGAFTEEEIHAASEVWERARQRDSQWRSAG